MDVHVGDAEGGTPDRARAQQPIESGPSRSASVRLTGAPVGATRGWCWWGIVFVGAFLASIIAGNMLTVGPSLYLPGASVAQLRAFYGTSGAAVIVQSGLQALAAIALYLFGIRIRAALRGAARRRGVMAMGWGTGIAAGSLLASVGCALVLMLVATSASDGAVAGLGRSALVLGGAAHLLGSGMLITVASTAALRSGARTRWVFGYGRIAGPVVALSAISVLFPPLIRPEPAFRLLAAVWIVGAAVAALRGRLTGGPIGQPSRRTGAPA